MRSLPHPRPLCRGVLQSVGAIHESPAGGGSPPLHSPSIDLVGADDHIRPPHPKAPSGRGLSRQWRDWGREQAVTCQMVRSIRPIPMSLLPPLSLRPRYRSATSLRLRCPAAATPGKAGLRLADRGAHCAWASSATGSAQARGPEGGFGAPQFSNFHSPSPVGNGFRPSAERINAFPTAPPSFTVGAIHESPAGGQ